MRKLFILAVPVAVLLGSVAYACSGRSAASYQSVSRVSSCAHAAKVRIQVQAPVVEAIPAPAVVQEQQTQVITPPPVTRQRVITETIPQPPIVRQKIVEEVVQQAPIVQQSFQSVYSSSAFLSSSVYSASSLALAPALAPAAVNVNVNVHQRRGILGRLSDRQAARRASYSYSNGW